MGCIINGNEIILSGTVGTIFWDDCFTCNDVILALAQIGHDKDITIRLNSGGGIATDGAAIHAAIARHKGKVTIIVEGIAASAASVIAMAADELQMSLGAVLMIHDPSSVTFGTITDHELTIRALTALAGAMAEIYATKSGRTIEECRSDMKCEMWLTGQQAVDLGYANSLLDISANDNAVSEPTAFDYHLYANTPANILAFARLANVNTPKHIPILQTKERVMTSKTSDNSQIAVSASQTNIIDFASAKAEGRAEAMARINEINDICALAGSPHMAQAFIAADTPPEAVRKALLEARAEASAKHIVSSHSAAPAQSLNTQNAQANWDKIVAAHNSKF
jgi:ATP-dependent Clp protease, protease subunit